MSKKQTNLTQEELNLIEETERFMEEVNADPNVANAELPPELYEKLLNQIHAKEKDAAEKAEIEELVRLGKVYRRKRKARKYWVMAAAAVLALALGITSLGDGERILEVLQLENLGKDQTQMNTDGAVDPLENIGEEELYQWFEDEYGVYPVVMLYRPEDVMFLEAQSMKDVNAVLINYGIEKEVNIICRLFPNYSEYSHGYGMEESTVNEYTVQTPNCSILIKEHQRLEDDKERWSVEFEYQNIKYSYRIIGINEDEVKKIIENLYFI